MGWKIREHWRRPTYQNRYENVWLLETDDVFVSGWRVEWEGPARREGASFSNRTLDDPAERERLARELLAARKAERPDGWERVA